MKKIFFLFFFFVCGAVTAYAAGMEKLPSDGETLKISVFLSPVVIQAEHAPAYLAGDFGFWLENGLLKNGVKLRNRKPLSDPPGPNGKTAGSRLLIQTTVTRFEILQIPYHVEETGAHGFRHVGNIGGYIRVIAEPEGNTEGSIPFEQQVLFGNSSSPENRNAVFADYGKFMIKSVISGKIVPELLKLPGLKAR